MIEESVPFLSSRKGKDDWFFFTDDLSSSFNGLLSSIVKHQCFGVKEWRRLLPSGEAGCVTGSWEDWEEFTQAMALWGLVPVPALACLALRIRLEHAWEILVSSKSQTTPALDCQPLSCHTEHFSTAIHRPPEDWLSTLLLLICTSTSAAHTWR